MIRAKSFHPHPHYLVFQSFCKGGGRDDTPMKPCVPMGGCHVQDFSSGSVLRTVSILPVITINGN